MFTKRLSELCANSNFVNVLLKPVSRSFLQQTPTTGSTEMTMTMTMGLEHVLIPFERSGIELSKSMIIHETNN